MSKSGKKSQLDVAKTVAPPPAAGPKGSPAGVKAELQRLQAVIGGVREDDHLLLSEVTTFLDLVSTTIVNLSRTVLNEKGKNNASLSERVANTVWERSRNLQKANLTVPLSRLPSVRDRTGFFPQGFNPPQSTLAKKQSQAPTRPVTAALVPTSVPGGPKRSAPSDVQLSTGRTKSSVETAATAPYLVTTKSELDSPLITLHRSPGVMDCACSGAHFAPILGLPRKSAVVSYKVSGDPQHEGEMLALGNMDWLMALPKLTSADGKRMVKSSDVQPFEEVAPHGKLTIAFPSELEHVPIVKEIQELLWKHRDQEEFREFVAGEAEREAYAAKGSVPDVHSCEQCIAERTDHNIVAALRTKNVSHLQLDNMSIPMSALRALPGVIVTPDHLPTKLTVSIENILVLEKERSEFIGEALSRLVQWTVIEFCPYLFLRFATMDAASLLDPTKNPFVALIREGTVEIVDLATAIVGATGLYSPAGPS